MEQFAIRSIYCRIPLICNIFFFFSTGVSSHLTVNVPRTILINMKPPPSVLRIPLWAFPERSPQKVSANKQPRDKDLCQTSPDWLKTIHNVTEDIMDEVKEGLRYVFQTKNRVVCCISGTGHAGMEATMSNLIEPGTIILIASNGIWGQRAADMAKRQDADVRMIEKPGGDNFTKSDIEAALIEHKPAITFMVQGESSTGVYQPLDGMGEICHKHGALLAVDAVASLGGVPFYMDDWSVDVVYTGTQKVISAPPSMAPIAFSDKAMSFVASRKSPTRSFYTDITCLANYWGCDGTPRKYHHTGPVSSVYALREALAIVCDEGLESLLIRHKAAAERLWAGLAELGLEMYVSDVSKRLPTVNTIRVPEGIDWMRVTKYFMSKYLVEISGGLGPSAGQVWRVGLMGYNCTTDNVDLVLKIMKEALADARSQDTASKL
ncbi:unnamed protein product, partial [Meganyctiphanes norvegica]